MKTFRTISSLNNAERTVIFPINISNVILKSHHSVGYGGPYLLSCATGRSHAISIQQIVVSHFLIRNTYQSQFQGTSRSQSSAALRAATPDYSIPMSFKYIHHIVVHHFLVRDTIHRNSDNSFLI